VTASLLIQSLATTHACSNGRLATRLGKKGAVQLGYGRRRVNGAHGRLERCGDGEGWRLGFASGFTRNWSMRRRYIKGFQVYIMCNKD
jgi:hypothetical protein